RAQHDLAERLGRGELTAYADARGDRLLRGNGQLAERAGGDLQVLRADGGDDVGGAEPQALELRGVDPHAHRALGAEQRRLADAGNALELVQDVARRIVAERDRIDLR